MNNPLMLPGLAAFMTILFVVGAFAASDSFEVRVGLPSDVPVLLDGHVSTFEYPSATDIFFTNAHGRVHARVKVAEEHLCFAFEIPDPTVHPGDDIVIMLDTGMSRADKPGQEHIRAYIRRKPENSRMHRGTGERWDNWYGGWEYRSQSYPGGWEIEARIPLEALGAHPEEPMDLGVALRIWDNDPQGKWNWPVSAHENQPGTWGTLKLFSND